MAYSQQGGNGRSQRPQYGLPETSYNSVRSQGHTQLAGTQSYGYDNGYGDGFGQHHDDQYRAIEDSGYDQRSPSYAPTHYQRNDGYYAGRGQQPQSNGRPDQHRRPAPTNGVGSGHSGTQRQEALPYDVRPPGNGQSRPQARNDQSRDHRRPPLPNQPYERYQNVVPPQTKAGLDYNKTFDAPYDDWQVQQGYHEGYGPETSVHQPEVRYQGRQQAPADSGNSHDHRAFQNSHQEAAHPKNSQPVTSKPHLPDILSRDQEPIRIKEPPKRILDDIKSPDTVAWDNPFPTFPAAKIKSKPNSEVVEHNQAESRSPEPHIPSSKRDRGPAQHSGSKGFGNAHNGGQDSHLQPPLGPQNGQKSDGKAQERPSASYTTGSGHRKQNSNPPAAYGRHSEDNRTRPTIATEVTRGSGYERSHTMPIAVTDAIVNPHDEMPEVAAWQEPGATAGYYGGEDKGFVSGSPIGNSQREPIAPFMVNADESRRHQPTSRFPPPVAQHSAPASQFHAQQDSVGDLFDSYYNETSPQTKPYVKDNPYQRRRASTDEMPNFDAPQNVSPMYDRGMAIDQHLQPQPPLPAKDFPERDLYANGGQYPTTSYRADSLPRSKSQPDFNGQRFPPNRPQQSQAFDFGVPDSGQPRPATSSSHGRSGPRGHFASAPTTDRHVNDTEIGGQEYSGIMPESQPWSRGRHGDFEHQHSRQSPDKHRPPPPHKRYADPRQQNGYRSPPQANGPYQGPTQPDRVRPSPQQFEPSQHPKQEDQYRTPPVQHGRPSDDRLRRPGGLGGPSPSNRSGPTFPPGKLLPNPDALPHHPAPVRPGLMGGSPVNSANKPPPVRQYNNNSSPVTLAGPSEAPVPRLSQEGKGKSNAVTYQELDKLRQKTQASPEDQATRCLLAKKLVEASTVLVNERTDQKTRDKAREDYIAQALKMLKKLSGNQYPDAMFYLGDCYSRGALGLQSDVKEAFTLYQSAAKANHPQAAYRVAVCCEMGQDEGGGTRKDPIKAMQWYKRAAQLGDVPAMYKMGVIQLKGLLGQPRNPREALVFLKKAAERADAENPHALHELGLLHEKGSEGIPKDEGYSKDLFVQCANLGYKFSQFRLGCAYEYGLMGCAVDPRQSIAWYSKAAVQEEHQSELALSGWYLTGSEGVLQQSDTEAYLWARKAAQAGMAKAEYAMGYFTEVGIGAPANLEDAKRWYWRAASQNFSKARERLEDLRKGGAAKQKTRVSRSHMKKQSDGECVVM